VSESPSDILPHDIDQSGSFYTLSTDKPSCNAINCLCHSFCLPCLYFIPPLRPLYLSFVFLPAIRKLWLFWLIASQLWALRYYQSTFGIVILSCAGVVGLSCLVWGLRARGWHRGMSGVQLVLWIPATIYIVMRLAGLERDSLDHSRLNEERPLFIYAIAECVTLGITCIWSFFDMLHWLRGNKYVWGMSDRSIGRVRSRQGRARMGTADTATGFGPNQPTASLDAPLLTGHGSTMSTDDILMDSSLHGKQGHGTRDNSTTRPRSPSASTVDYSRFTPATHADLVLRRAEEVMQAQLFQEQQKQQQQQQQHSESSLLQR